MADAALMEESADYAEKGLKAGAIGLISSVVIGVASTAPAYSLASTLGFVVVIIGLQSPALAVIAFIPMWMISVAYNELNKADPDCGTTFTWGTRAFGPTVGWFGGWGIVAADVLVMASLAQIAGQYVFLLVGANGIGADATSGWVLVVGILWIVAMTYICYRGIEVSANFQKALLGVELTMLVLLSGVALYKVANGSAPVGHLTPTWAWFDVFKITSFSGFVNGLLLMVFIYWGWDTAVSCNEETADKSVIPGRAAVISTFLLLATYVLIIVAAQSFAGLGTHGIGLGNPQNQGDVLSVLGHAVFGGSAFGTVMTRLLILMVLSSAAASTQTTILPTARTTLSMAVYKSIPKTFSKVHRKHLTPTISTVVMGLVSIGLYIGMNFVSAGSVIVDSVSALGVMIAFYYGLTGFACFWFYRSTLTSSLRNLFMRGVFPLLGGLILYSAMFYDFVYYWSPSNSDTSWTLPIPPHWHMGGVFVIDIIGLLIGAVVMLTYRRVAPPFFKGEVLHRGSPTLLPDGKTLAPIGD